MKRLVEVLGLALLIVGVEWATGAVSHGLQRVHSVYLQVRFGTHPEISVSRFAWGIALAAAGGGLLALDLWARAYSRLVSGSKLCPRCGAQTERVKRRLPHRLLAALAGRRITRRKCKSCGWTGLAG